MKDMAIEWEYTVRRVENGFEIISTEDLEDGGMRTNRYVFEADEVGEWADHEALIRCLWFLTESFGLCGSKHDPKQIRIELINQGDHEE